MAKIDYMRAMRILATCSVILFASALSFSASACDRHGGGGYGNFGGGGGWNHLPDFNSDFDVLVPKEKSSVWGKPNLTPKPVAKAPKPTFSKVSSRASIAAKEVLSAKADTTKASAASSMSIVAQYLRF